MWSVTRYHRSDTNDKPYFNSHAHVERDLGAKRYAYEEKDFNSHAHVERDQTQ